MNEIEIDNKELFYCNQNDAEYNNNPCFEQCNFCKQVEAAGTQKELF